MDSDEETAAAIVVCVLAKRSKRRKRKRSVWVKPWLTRRNVFGFYDTLMQELRQENIEEYIKFLKMPPMFFDEILQLIEEDIKKQNTILREPIPAKVKLAATLKFLSSGMNYVELQYLFRVHKSTLCQFIPKVCEAIYTRMKGKYLKVI